MTTKTMSEPKPIHNLNFLDPDKILIDGDGAFFIVNSSSVRQDDQECYLKLIEINEHFAIVTMTLPIACNKDGLFISKNDKDFSYKLFETHWKKEELFLLVKGSLKKST